MVSLPSPAVPVRAYKRPTVVVVGKIGNRVSGVHPSTNEDDFARQVRNVPGRVEDLARHSVDEWNNNRLWSCLWSFELFWRCELLLRDN